MFASNWCPTPRQEILTSSTGGISSLGIPPVNNPPGVAKDFTGDGIADIYRTGATNATLFKGASNGVFTAQTWNNVAAMESADFDGDGKADLFHNSLNTQTGDWLHNIYLSTGSGFQGQGSTSYTGISAQSRWMFGDYNGDGKTDLAHIFPGSAGVNIDVHVSDGHKLVKQRWVTNLAAVTISSLRQTWIRTWTPASGATRMGAFSGDFNGDGRADLGIAGEPARQSEVILSNGVSFPATGNSTTVVAVTARSRLQRRWPRGSCARSRTRQA